MGGFFSNREAGLVPNGVVNPFPVPQFCPQPEVMIAGFPMGQVSVQAAVSAAKCKQISLNPLFDNILVISKNLCFVIASYNLPFDVRSAVLAGITVFVSHG